MKNKNILKWAGYVSLPFFIMLVAVLLKWEHVSYYALGWVADFYADRADIALEIGRISGSPLSETTLENVSIRPADGQPQAYHFKTRSISCSYDFWDLRDGIELFIQGLDCRVNDPVFAYDLRVAAAQDRPDDDPEQFFAPPLLPKLDVHNGSVNLVNTEWDVAMREINSSLRPGEAGQELLFAIKNFQLNQDNVTKIETGFTAKLLYSGSKLTIASLEFGEKEISASGFIDLAQSDKELIKFATDIAFIENRVNIAGLIENSFLKAEARTNNFDIGELQKRLGGSGWDIFGIIRGQVELGYNLELHSDLEGSFAFDVQDGQLNSVDIDAVTVAGNFQNGELSISKAAAKTPGNLFTLSNVSVPMVLVSGGKALEIIRGTQAEFEAEITDVKTLLKLFKLEDEVLALPDVPHSLSFQGNLQNGELSISKAAATTPGNLFTLSNVSVPMVLVSDGKALEIIRGTQAEFEAEITDVKSLLMILQFEDKLQSLPAMPNLFSFQGNLKNGVLLLDDAKVAAVDSSLTISQAEIPVPATAKAFESAPISLFARFESSSLQETAGLLGNIDLNGQVMADINITGSIKEPKGDIKLSGENLSFKDLQMGSLALQGEVKLIQEAPGKLQSAHFTVTELSQTNVYGMLALSTPATVSWQPEKFLMNGAFQVDGQGEVTIGIAKLKGREITAEISTSNLDSSGWLENYVDNSYFFQGATIKTVLTGPTKSPQLQIAGTINKAGAKDVPFPLTGSFDLHYSSQGITISEFTWKSQERNQLSLTGHLPYDPLAPQPYIEGDLSLMGNIDFPALEDIGGLLDPWVTGKGSLALDMDLSGSWKQPVGHVLVKAKDFEPPARLQHYLDSSVNFTCDINAQGNSIILNSADLDSTSYSAQASGSWQYGISVKELLQKRKAELKGEVTADATVKIKELNFLQKQLPWLRRLEGDIQGELHVAGVVNDPVITGSFTMKDGEISHTFNLPMLSAVNLQGDFDRHSITIHNMQAEVGGSPVSLSGNINKVEESAAVDLHVSGKNVLLFRNNDMRMRGDVQLDVSGPLERLIIKGTTGMTGGYYTRSIDFLGMIGSGSAPVSEGSNFLFSFTDPPLRDAVLDIKITTIEPFKVRNNLIRGVLRPELFLKGTGELPFLLGTIYIDPSRVLLPSGGLQIQSGLLRFLEGKPDRPQLNILAQSKVLGYDINVTTRGPLDDPVITLSSSPALPSDDLMLLLLTGQPPEQDAAGGAKSSGTTNVMVYLGRDFLNRWFEDESGTADETILDRFELDFGRSVTKSGEQTVDSTFRLSKETTGTGKIFYLTGEKDKYDAINYGLKLVFRLE